MSGTFRIPSRLTAVLLAVILSVSPIMQTVAYAGVLSALGKVAPAFTIVNGAINFGGAIYSAVDGAIDADEGDGVKGFFMGLLGKTKEARIEEIENTVKEIDGKIDTITASIKKMSSDIDTIISQLNTLTGKFNQGIADIKVTLYENQLQMQDWQATYTQINNFYTKYSDVRRTLETTIQTLNDRAADYEAFLEEVSKLPSGEAIYETLDKLDIACSNYAEMSAEEKVYLDTEISFKGKTYSVYQYVKDYADYTRTELKTIYDKFASDYATNMYMTLQNMADCILGDSWQSSGNGGIGEIFYKLLVMSSSNSEEVHQKYKEFALSVQYDFLLTAYVCTLALKSQVAYNEQTNTNFNETATFRQYLQRTSELVEHILVYGEYEYEKCIMAYDFDGFVPDGGLTYDDFVVYYANPTNKLTLDIDEPVFQSKKAISLSMNAAVTNPNLYLAAGETDQIKVWYRGEEIQTDYPLVSSDDCVIVDADGTVAGISPGTATISLIVDGTSYPIAIVSVSACYAVYDGGDKDTYVYHETTGGTYEKQFLTYPGEGYSYEYCTDITYVDTIIDSGTQPVCTLSDVVQFNGVTAEDYEISLRHRYGKLESEDGLNLLFSHPHTGALLLTRAVDGKRSAAVVPIANTTGEIVQPSSVTYDMTGKDSNTVYIYNKQDLINWKNTYDKNYTSAKKNVKLMNDIDFGWDEWTGIKHALVQKSTESVEFTQDKKFTAETYTFDGNGHTIRNITFAPTENKMYAYVNDMWGTSIRAENPVVTYGFFSKLTGTVKNLTIENVKYSDRAVSSTAKTWPRIYSVFSSVAESKFSYYSLVDQSNIGTVNVWMTSVIDNCVAAGVTEVVPANDSANKYYDPFGNFLDASWLYVAREGTEFTAGFAADSEQYATIKNCVYNMECTLRANRITRASMFNYVRAQQGRSVDSNIYAGELKFTDGSSSNISLFFGTEFGVRDVDTRLHVLEGSTLAGVNLSDYIPKMGELFDGGFMTGQGWNSGAVKRMLAGNDAFTYQGELTVDPSAMKGVYFTGEALDTENLLVYDGDGNRITNFSVAAFDTSTVGTKTVKVTAGKYTATFTVEYVSFVPLHFQYGESLITRFAKSGSKYTLPDVLFTRDDGYIQKGWVLNGNMYDLNGSVTVSGESTFDASWREGEPRTITFGETVIQTKEGMTIEVPDFNGYDANLEEPTHWYCEDGEPAEVKPGDSLYVTEHLTFILKTEPRYTTAKVSVYFQNLDDDEYTLLGTAVYDKVLHGVKINDFYADAFDQLQEKYAEEDRDWLDQYIVRAKAENCNTDDDGNYLVNVDADSTVSIWVDRPEYSVEWKDVTGETKQTDILRYGAIPSLPKDILFVAEGYMAVWDREPEPVIENTSYQVTEEVPSPYTDYTVNHLWQNVDDDEYTLYASEVLTGTTDEDTDAKAKEYAGFTAQPIRQTVIDGDGSTVVNIYYDRNEYVVTWDIEGELTTENYRYGAVPKYKGETPQKAADVQYSYTFKDWGEELLPVFDHVTYTAVFDHTLNKYGITWDIEGKIWTEYYDYGETPSYKGKTPEKDADVQYTYTFRDWGEITPVTGAKTYYAIFDHTLNQYTITWNVEDETFTEVYTYGDTPIYKGTKPVKLSDSANTYAFNGWGQMEPVAGNKTYTAQFVSTANKYTITWEVNGEKYDELYAYGEMPSYKGVTPVKADTDKYAYTFDGWGDIEKVTGDKTYTAVFDKSLKKYTITWNADGNVTTEQYEYGEKPLYKSKTPTKSADAQYTYTFKDWGSVLPVTGDHTYTAVFDQKVNQYHITWIVEGMYFTETYDYGEIPVYKGFVPEKASTSHYTYTFDGWGEIAKVTGNKSYTAAFRANSIKQAAKAVDVCKLEYDKTVYDGRIKTPQLTVKDSQGNELQSGKDYSVYYPKDRKAVGRYKVTVVFCGEYSGQRDLYFTIVPKAPSKAKAQLYGHDDIQFSWSESKGASGYYVYYKNANKSKYTLFRRTTETSVKQAGFVDGAKFELKVVPYYSDGNNIFISTAFKTATVQTLKRVSKPTVKKSGLRVKVQWKNIDGETGYQISQSTYKNGTNVVATYKTAKGTYKKVKADKGKTYYYKVRAYKTVDGKKIFGPWSKPTTFKRK